MKAWNKENMKIISHQLHLQECLRCNPAIGVAAGTGNWQAKKTRCRTGTGKYFKKLGKLGTGTGISASVAEPVERQLFAGAGAEVFFWPGQVPM
jgi:hypothetical protein